MFTLRFLHRISNPTHNLITLVMRQSKSACSIAKALILLGFALSTNANGQGSGGLWRTEHETQFGVGLDTNIYGSRSGETKDGFLTATQSIGVSRRNSLTHVSLNGNASKTIFFEESDADFLDGSLELNLAYPEDSSDVTFWKARAFINRESQVNLDAGRRIQPTAYGARLSSELFLTPKTGLVGTVNAVENDRSRDGLSSSRSISLKTGISRAWRAERRWNAEYGLKFGESDAGTDSTHHTFGLRGRGKFSPKIKSETYLGVRQSDFTGRQNFSDTGPIVSLNAIWQSSPRLSVEIGAESDYRFTASGFAVLNSEVNLSIKQSLSRGFKFTTYLATGRTKYERTIELRSDRYWILRGEFEYAFTNRFFTRLSVDLTDSNSSAVNSDLNRGLVYLYSGLRY